MFSVTGDCFSLNFDSNDNDCFLLQEKTEEYKSSRRLCRVGVEIEKLKKQFFLEIFVGLVAKTLVILICRVSLNARILDSDVRFWFS